MPFVQVYRSKTLSRERYQAMRDQASGGQLLDGQLFYVDGYQGDELRAIDAWETREQCDRGMEKWGPAMEAAGVGMEDFTVEEFEIDELRLGSGDRTAVS
jgi:hypothetical protein